MEYKCLFLAVVAVTVFVLCRGSTNPCPDHWAYFSGSCLYFSFHTAESWTDAQQLCSEHNKSHLVTIDNEDKSDYIRSVLEIFKGSVIGRVGGHTQDAALKLEIRHNYVRAVFNLGEQSVHWTGGTDLQNEGQWTWIENSLAIGPFTKWAAGYPNNHTVYTDCMVTNLDDGDLVWRDRPCYTRYNFICEFRVSDPTQGIVIGK